MSGTAFSALSHPSTQGIPQFQASSSDSGSLVPALTPKMWKPSHKLMGRSGVRHETSSRAKPRAVQLRAAPSKELRASGLGSLKLLVPAGTKVTRRCRMTLGLGSSLNPKP